MSAFSDYLEAAVCNWIRGTAMPTAPTNVYVALFNGSPTDAGSGGAELTTTITGAATRTTSAFATPIDDGGGGKSIQNSSTVTITASASGGATATHVAIYDAATSGNLLLHGALTSSLTISTGDEVRFNAGQLKIIIA